MSTNYTINAGQFITEAFRKGGMLQPPWTPTADQLSTGLLNLNYMLKGLQTYGPNLWRLTQVSWTIGTGVGYAGNPYQVTPLILTLADARLVVNPSPNLYERPLSIYSYEDYMLLPNKMSLGTPSVIAFDRQATVSNFYIWPLPTNGCVINATVARTINDVLTVNDDLDIPVEWTEGLIWMLADRLLDDGGVRESDPATSQSVTLHAAAFAKQLLDFDRPDAIYLRPMGKTGAAKIWKY
jgi:hypothetical protein